MATVPLPPDVDRIRALARRAIAPLKPVDEVTAKIDGQKLFHARRTNAGRSLPPYYLVYFLLVELLGYHNAGQWEKTAWSVAVDLDGKAFLVEHRKMGVGVFAQDGDADEPQAQRIVQLISKAVDVAEPYFVWLAQDAVHRSRINVVNTSASLFERYEFFCESHAQRKAQADARKNERVVRKWTTDSGTAKSVQFPSYKLYKEAQWLAMAAVDAFYSWTEHVFIHIAALQSCVNTGDSIASLAKADWSDKYKAAVGLNDEKSKSFYDKLVVIRRQLRNFVAHGAFGKQGEAFKFHSGAGAVPVLLETRHGQQRFSMFGPADFNEVEALEVMAAFVDFLWSGSRSPARVYVQEHALPLIVPYAADGTYAGAMSSVQSMTEFADYLSAEMDRSANMDW